MTSQEIYAKALRLIEVAKATAKPTHRNLLMDQAHGLIRVANRLKQNEPARPPSPRPVRHRVSFEGERGYLYFDLPMSRRSDVLWAAEALAAALSQDYERYALWDGETRLFSSSTSHAVFSCETAIEVNAVSQSTVLEAEELAINNHEVLRHSRRLLEMIRKMRSVLGRTDLADPR
jgi:hypothetical protein